MLIAIVVAPLFVVTFVFVLEVAFGLRPLASEPRNPVSPKATIIVPAHNEQQGICSTLESLREAAAGVADILVVADNCTDDTAKLARRFIEQVIERDDAEHFGKGFALDFARAHLSDIPPEVVLVIDSDCRTDRGSLQSLISATVESDRPCQAVNLLRPPSHSSPLVEISSFAFLVKNLVRQRGLQRLSGRVHLTGTGMAFPWRLFAMSPLASGSIVEDLQLGIWIAESGHPPRLVEEALVVSPAASDEGTMAQRRRWEGGYFQVAMKVAPRLLFRSVPKKDIPSAVASIDLLIPPIALLIAADLALLALLLAGHRLGLQFASVGAWLISAVLLACGVVLALAWWRAGRNLLPLAHVTTIPLYVLRKIPHYIALAASGAPRRWTRGER